MDMAKRTSIDAGRRNLIGAASVAAALTFVDSALANAPVQVELWKDPSCGCCQDWVTHLQSGGFVVKVHDVGNNAVRARLGIDRKYGSCHTALVAGYAIEGHVPAADIRRLLRERPQALGLAVPGMPVGSPGMDGAVYGDRKDPYSVMLLAKDGSASVYRKYAGKTEGAKS
ncbi:DUF411 domain-containing protein [Ramlibacter sp. PS3R-8]|uniref:DUF411 domain-containing protein n=1 Tax=Ramlibacter sp. PS3R-8 TaxID=3133437 RepID=UPI003095AB43